MAGYSAHLLDVKEQTVSVAVGKYGPYFLEVSAFLAFVPQLFATARPVIRFARFKRLFDHWFDMFYLSLVRLVAIPVVLLLLLRLLPLEPDAFETAAVVAAMPAASSSVLVARQYGGDYEFAGQAIIITTVLSLATIPLLLRFFL